ncbi:MAG: DUF502 domain-containing protein [Cetobacterium sp.]|uniref:DUF502 domain-containing protein n=1 Tax=unclassified Cetobacterium TaxID=2630983 RepID=UPI00163CFBB4|nr:DUF502 domain-containing protein [Cetobacterium sp. 2A]MBC2856609.1 DUF502 domain-containing protein [Cetobacterium sp. 2A]
MKNRVRSYFYGGLISLLPIVLTIYIFDWILNIFIRLLKDSFITVIIRDLFTYFGKTSDFVIYIDWLINIFSLLTMIIFITLVGYTMRIIIFARIAKWIKAFLMKIPLVKHIYPTISQIVSLISSEKASSYQKVVLVEYPRKGTYSLGFLTSEQNHIVEELCETETIYNIFIPTSPNPTSGMFIMMPKDEVRVLDMKIDDAVKLIISGGVILPEKRG